MDRMTYEEAIEVVKRELICRKMTMEECRAMGDCTNCPGHTKDKEFEALETIIFYADSQEETVYCKDCIYWIPCEGSTEFSRLCEHTGYIIGENSHCVYGKRGNKS